MDAPSAVRHYDDALVSLAHGDRTQAKHLLCCAYDSCPTFPDPLYVLARLEHEDGHQHRCREFLKALLKVSPGHVGGLELGREYDLPVHVRPGPDSDERPGTPFSADAPSWPEVAGCWPIDQEGLRPNPTIEEVEAEDEEADIEEGTEQYSTDEEESDAAEPEGWERLDDLGLDSANPNYGDLAAEGTDPQEIDWDSTDYEVE